MSATTVPPVTIFNATFTRFSKKLSYWRDTQDQHINLTSASEIYVEVAVNDSYVYEDP